MASIKNEHLVWVVADAENGEKHVFIGLTDTGLQYLKANPGHSLDMNPTINLKDVTNIHVFNEKNKDAIKDIFRKTGMVVSEVN